MKYYSFIFLFIFQFIILKAQEIPIGHWRDELPYNELIAIEESENFIFAATPYSLLSYHKKDAALTRISKVNGLNDFGISTIGYNVDYQVLLIAYENANIDLIKDKSIININDIKRKNILGKKSINGILFLGKYAYLSCGFGIVVVDLEREEIKDTYYLGSDGQSFEVFDMDILNDEFYAATNKGIYRADINNLNLNDFSHWTKLSHIPFPDDPYTQIETFNGRLVANRWTNVPKDQLFGVTATDWIEVFSNIEDKTLDLNMSQGRLFSSHNHAVGEINNEFLLQLVVDSYGSNPNQNIQPNQVQLSEDGKFYIADGSEGLVISPDLKTFQFNIINGPASTKVFDISTQGSKVVVASGGRDESFSNVFLEDGIFVYEDGLWTNYSKENTPSLDPIYDFVCVDINPNNKEEFAVGSWGKGLFTFDANGFDNAYNQSNSSLTPNSTYSHIMRLGGVAYDSKNNLWVASAVSNALLHKRKPSGEWSAYEFGGWSAYDIKDMLADKRDVLWIVLRGGGANMLFAFDESQAANQQLKGLNSNPGTGNLPGSQVLSVLSDLNGELWVGTDKGIGVIYQPENIFNQNNVDAQRIIVERDGYAQYLLDSEKVKAMAIDGANRKWIGTERAGVFLISADGQQELQHFTSENSPLYSNNITALGVNDQGEVYIGTDKGLLVYKGSATKGNQENFNDVYAYPNPVRPDYLGPIAIKGLTIDAYVKITDISGRLVNEMRSEGGQAIWNGENINGERVQTGIYLVFIANVDGTESMVTKIMFIR